MIARLASAFSVAAIGMLIVGALLALVSGAVLMFAVAAIHSHWIPAVPLIGYWTAVLVAFAVNVFFVRPSTS